MNVFSSEIKMWMGQYNMYPDNHLGTVHLIFWGGLGSWSEPEFFFRTISEQDYFFRRTFGPDYFFHNLKLQV